MTIITRKRCYRCGKEVEIVGVRSTPILCSDCKKGVKMFSAQHYIKVAEVIRERIVPYNSVSPGAVIGEFAEMFMKDNPKFNPGTFWDECQPLDEKGKKNGNQT
jgi:DNA-directed RNA polymerase subunit RPC12/RpoP